ERASMGLTWSPDSKWLAYAKTGSNYLRKINLWSVDSGKTIAVTDPMADSFSPAWDQSGKYMYFLASTDIALASGWANTSSMKANPTHGAYIIVLSNEETTPFPLKSDEESEEGKEADKSSTNKKDDKTAENKDVKVKIDFDGIERRTLAMSLPLRSYGMIIGGPKGTAFIAESVPNTPGLVLHKFTLEGKKNEEFAKNVSNIKLSENREKILFKSANKWRVVSTSKKPESSDGNITMDLRMELDRKAEWKQIFDEAWRYEKDYFYDPDIHGRNWDEVKERYEPLIPYIQHRSDLTYILDQMNGELSVGHSFVFGGDFPAVDTTNTGLLGADLDINNGKWRIKKIYTAESWNPELKAPLDQPGLKVKEGQYLLAVNGVELSANDDPYKYFAGTAGKQTLLHINDKPTMDGAHTITVEPIKSENGLRQRAWVEDNRRKVDELSDGKLAYVWVPNTGSPGYVSFNRYFFAQQDKAGAVIDERYNGGGLLDDYMVDLMTRKLRAAITNEVPDAVPFRLPAGILGPKVLLINEMAGSGGDFFPWVFKNQNAGPLIGKRTWGGLVKSSVHYAFIDGGAMTSPDNAVFDPIRNEWIGENRGIAPDIEIGQDAKSVAEGRDVQLEAAVKEALRLLEIEGTPEIVPPPFPKPALRPEAR
ncbi:MAG TPA: PDZ domain-containing protein, partial [Anditalea sp.]|nr:PDZ domain-containing protein [Anditalea sp.]